MYFIKYDNVEGTILGLSKKVQLDFSDGWVTTNEDCYNFILDHNGEYIVDTENEALKTAVSEYTAALSSYDSDLAEVDLPVVVAIDYLSKISYSVTLEELLVGITTKNSAYCKNLIETGVKYAVDGNVYRFTYTVEDQLNYADLEKAIVDENLTSIPVRGTGEDEYIYISAEEFTKLNESLKANRFYQLFRLREFNSYLSTITDKSLLKETDYESGLPEEYEARAKAAVQALGYSL